MSEDAFERICLICGSSVRLDEGLCRRCGHDLMDSPPDHSPSQGRLDRPLASMRVYRREFGMFLILFGFGFALLAGGWVQAYFGGVWRLSSHSNPIAAEISLMLLSNYSQCAGLVSSSLALHSMFGPLAASTSCSLYSLDHGGLAFAALGGASMVVGLAAFKKRFSSVGERIGPLWWVLALTIPLIGGMIGYISVREKNRTSAISMALLGIETLLGSVLLYILTGFPLSVF